MESTALQNSLWVSAAISAAAMICECDSVRDSKEKKSGCANEDKSVNGFLRRPQIFAVIA